MLRKSIVYILTSEAQTECNPYKWELAKMLYALQQIHNTAELQQSQAQRALNNPLQQDIKQ